MKIPSKFKMANNWITVEFVDKTENNNYGNFNDVTATIQLARNIEVDNKTIALTEYQINNTFWHEYCHAMQFYFDNSTSEAQAQSYSNFLSEFFDTKVDE